MSLLVLRLVKLGVECALLTIYSMHAFAFKRLAIISIECVVITIYFSLCMQMHCILVDSIYLIKSPFNVIDMIIFLQMIKHNKNDTTSYVLFGVKKHH